MVLGWYELPDDDRPPERIWLDDKALSAHFEAVNERYRSPRSGKGGGEDWEAVPGGEWQRNELTEQFRR